MLSPHDGGFDGESGVVGRGADAAFVVDGVLAGLAGVVATGARVVGTGVDDDGSGGTGCASASAADSVMGPLADFRKTAHVAVMAPPQMTRITSVTTIRFVVKTFVMGPSTATRHRTDMVQYRSGPGASGTEPHSCCASDSKRRQMSPGAAITRAPPWPSPMLLLRR